MNVNENFINTLTPIMSTKVININLEKGEKN